MYIVDDMSLIMFAAHGVFNCNQQEVRTLEPCSDVLLPARLEQTVVKHSRQQAICSPPGEMTDCQGCFIKPNV